MKSKLLTIAVTRFYEPILNKLASQPGMTKAKAIRSALAKEFKLLWPEEYRQLCEAEKLKILEKYDLTHIIPTSPEDI